MNKLRVLLVDDHAVLRAGLRLLVNSQADLQVVGEADTTADALTQSQTSHPDVVIVDLTLPGGGSLELIRRLVMQDSPPRILVLTMHDEPAYVRAALAAGSTGYVVKTISEQELLAALRDVARGQVVVDLDDSARTAAVFSHMLAPAREQGVAATAKLSDRETEVLRLLAQGFSNHAVADRLELSPKTVATYRARIAQKLGLKSTVDYVKFATDMGLPAAATDLR